MSKTKTCLLGLAVLLVWLGPTLLIAWHFKAQAGTAGDAFGASNALFAGLALLGVVFTLYQQQKEASQNKHDTDAQLEVMRGQLTALQQQVANDRFPHLRSNGTDISEFKIECRFVNEGGRFSITENYYITQTEAQIRFSKYVFEHGETGFFTLQNPKGAVTGPHSYELLFNCWNGQRLIGRLVMDKNYDWKLTFTPKEPRNG